MKIFLRDELDALESSGMSVIQVHSQLLQCSPGIRHESFAAGFIDGRYGAIGHHHSETLLPRCNGRGQPGRAAANHEYICIEPLLSHRYHRNRTNSEQKPGPMAASTL